MTLIDRIRVLKSWELYKLCATVWANLLLLQEASAARRIIERWEAQATVGIYHSTRTRLILLSRILTRPS